MRKHDGENILAAGKDIKVRWKINSTDLQSGSKRYNQLKSAAKLLPGTCLFLMFPMLPAFTSYDATSTNGVAVKKALLHGLFDFYDDD